MLVTNLLFTKLSSYQIVCYQIVSLPNCQVTTLSIYQIVGLPNYQVTKLLVTKLLVIKMLVIKLLVTKNHIYIYILKNSQHET